MNDGLGADHGAQLCGRLEGLHFGVDVLELGVAVGVAGALARLGIGLQAEAQTVQQAADQLLVSGEIPLGQRRGQMTLALADPPQGSLGIIADRRLHEAVQDRSGLPPSFVGRRPIANEVSSPRVA